MEINTVELYEILPARHRFILEVFMSGKNLNSFDLKPDITTLLLLMNIRPYSQYFRKDDFVYFLKVQKRRMVGFI